MLLMSWTHPEAVGQEERQRHYDQADRNTVQTLSSDLGNRRVTDHVLLTLQALGCQFVSPGDDQCRQESKRKYNYHKTDSPVRYSKCRKQCAGHLDQQPCASQVGDGNTKYVTAFKFVVLRHASWFSYLARLISLRLCGGHCTDLGHIENYAKCDPLGETGQAFGNFHRESLGPLMAYSVEKLQI